MEAERKWLAAKVGWTELKEGLGHQPDEIDVFSGNIEDVVSRLKSLSVYCRSIGLRDVELNAGIYGEEFDLELLAKRLETQEEADDRVEKNRKERERKEAEKVRLSKAREERDKSEYERLKKKYS